MRVPTRRARNRTTTRRAHETHTHIHTQRVCVNNDRAGHSVCVNNESQPESGEAVSVLVCMVEPNFVCLECVSGDRVCESERGVWCASCLRHTVVCRVATAPDEDKSGRDLYG